jgi:hypothetical protein
MKLVFKISKDKVKKNWIIKNFHNNSLKIDIISQLKIYRIIKVLYSIQ